MSMVLDSPVLPWDDLQVQDLHMSLTEAYPGADVAKILVSRVRDFPIHTVNWADEHGALAIWYSILNRAAAANVLRRLLNCVLDDKTVAGYHEHIRSIVAELDSDAAATKTADEALTDQDEDLAQSPPHVIEGLADPDLQSGDMFGPWERVVLRRCRDALNKVVPAAVENPELSADSIGRAEDALSTLDGVLRLLAITADTRASDPDDYARLIQAKQKLAERREKILRLLRKLRATTYHRSVVDLCERLSEDATQFLGELEIASSLL